MRRVYRLATWMLFLFVAAPSFAADTPGGAFEYSLDRWGRENGFSWGSVTSISQSADGYLWVGTDKGLVRFDGYGFRLFENAGSGLKIGAVHRLFADHQGNLWILLATTELLRYHDGRFEAGRDEAQFGITAVGQRKDGSVVFSSSSFGPLTYVEGNYKRLLAERSAGGGNSASQHADTLSSRLSWATGVIPHRFVQMDLPAASIAETTDGALWLGTREAGLFYLPPGQALSEARDVLKEPVHCLLPKENGELWVGTDHGVLRWDGKQLTETGIPKSLRGGKAVAAMHDRDGNSWVAMQDGLVRVDRTGMDEKAQDKEAELTALYEDREGDVWIGTREGLQRVRDNTFNTFAIQGDSASGGPLYIDETGRVWFAPLDGGLRWIKGRESGVVSNDGLERDVVYSLSGHGSELWIGRQRGGLTRLEYGNGGLRTRTYKQRDGLAQDNVYAVYESRDGTIWAGTLNGGVSSYSKLSFTTYTTADGMSSNSVMAITERPDHSIWFATADGLDEFAGGRWRVFRTNEGLPSSELTCLLTDSEGTLWIGTKAGVAFLRSGSGTIQVPENLPKILQEETLGIAEDKFGWLWVATTNHVFRVNREKLLAGAVADSDLREYGFEDGLRGTEGVKRTPSVVADARGRIWVSTNRGISVVDPKHALRAVAPVIVHIDAVSVDGTPIDLSSPVLLNEKPRRVMVTFTGLNLSAPDRIQYKYKLENVDEKWSEPVKERQVTYSNLGSGTYRFVVAATDGGGMWNSSESSVQFQIAPAFWETWWFRVASVVAIALIIFAVYRLRMGEFQRSASLRFEERLLERTRIAQELHDTLLQGFLSASMQLHVIMDQLPEDSPTRPPLARVLNLIGRVIEEGRNAVRGLRMSNSNDLGEALSRIRSEFPNQEGVAFRVLVEGTPRPLHPIIRDEVYRIGHEALMNAFRHSKADAIEAELEYAPDGLRLVVRDTGIGLDPNEPERKSESHWGLTGMRERAQKIGASFKILTRVGTGTEVDLWVPSQVAFLSSSRDPNPSWIAKVFGRSTSKSIEERRSRE